MSNAYNLGDITSIFEHGGKSEKKAAVILKRFSDDDLIGGISVWAARLKQFVTEPTSKGIAAYEHAKAVFSFARELERRRLMAAVNSVFKSTRIPEGGR